MGEILKFLQPESRRSMGRRYCTLWFALAMAPAFSLVLLAPELGLAQDRFKLNGDAMVPKTIRGRAVESAVINRVVLVFGELKTEKAGLAEDDEDDPVVDTSPTWRERAALYSGTFEELVYGKDSSSANAFVFVDHLLQEKLEQIDSISTLNDQQRRKLHLAARGDIKRLFDRADKLRAQCERYTEIDDANDFQTWTEDLKREARVLKRLFLEGPFNANSLMAKCMNTVLTAEQAAQYSRFEPLYQPVQRRRLLEGALAFPEK